MNEFRKKYDRYRMDKRIEISAMSTIIQSLGNEITPREKDLLIRSFIVLTYAYWESVFHKLQEYLYKVYSKKPIKNLPFNLKNKVYLKLVNDNSGKSKNKPINQITSHIFFDELHSNMHSNEELSVEELEPDKYKYIFILKTGNPSIDLFKDVLSEYDFNLDKLIKKSIEDKLLSDSIVNSIDFLIKQRNAIAHKNEHISYGGHSYVNYTECIDAFEKDNAMLNIPPEEFVMELSFQVDSLFRIVTDEIESRNKEEISEDV